LIAVFLSVAAVCFAALFLGQAVLRLAGATEWNWLAPPVGLAAMMLAATPTVHVPGRTVTMAILLAVLAIAAAVWCLRSPPHRPPLSGLLAALPVVVLVAMPFLAAGRGGILGVTVNNDMAVHLVFVEGYVSAAVTAVTPLPHDYPLGPHALAALLTTGLGTKADFAFSGVTMALPVISAWTVLAVVRRASWFGKAVAATVVGLPFLVAAYYGQGSFKEVAQAGFVLAVALSLSGCGPRLGRGRWVPLALLIGGVISVFSLPGLPWPLAFIGLWAAGQLAILAWRRRLRELPGIVRRELPALGIGLGVLVAVLLPQAQRMAEFLALRDGSGIAVDNYGNLVAPLSGWQALGIWDVADFRLTASPAFIGGVLSFFVLALVLFGSYWALRRGRWLLPLAAAGALLIWKLSDNSQSPYVTAKALVVASPLLLLVAVLPLVDREEGRRKHWAWLAVPLLGLVLFLRVAGDDLRTLRWSPVGPTDHARQVQSFRAPIDGGRTLFLGGSEFITWELAGVPAQPVALATLPILPLRPQKDWEGGQAMDFDTVRAATLNEYEWILSYRDPVASEPPPQLRLVRASDDYQLWKRVGKVRERSTLAEGEWPGGLLRCGSEDGRAVLAGGGVAAVRPAPIVAPVEPVAAGETGSVGLRLPAGSWDLTMPYMSPQPVRVTAPGLDVVLPANLDRAGPRFPVGRITLRRDRPLSIEFQVEETPLTPSTAVAALNYVAITPADSAPRVVPIERACGKYVDWYRPAAS
jgi:hypothetical protein